MCFFPSDVSSYDANRRLGSTLGSIFGVTVFLLVVFVSLLLVLSFCGPLGRIYTKVATGGVVDAWTHTHTTITTIFNLNYNCLAQVSYVCAVHGPGKMDDDVT